MENADENMDDFQGSSELKCNYLVIKKELEVYLGDILTQCEDMQEVKTILDYNPDDDDDDELDDSDTNWQVALYKGHKSSKFPTIHLEKDDWGRINEYPNTI